MNVELCCGCSACDAACPPKAITIVRNRDGFYAPVIDPLICVHCGACEKVCPIGKKSQDRDFAPIVYACRNLDAAIVETSSSGGVFRKLGQVVLLSGGAVYGCAWGENLNAKHIRVDDAQELHRLSKSKYVQSDLQGVFEDVLRNLRQGKLTMFSGTPCQVAGLYSFLGRDYEKLITVDVICHGVPSPKVLDIYRSYLEEKVGSSVENIDFRDKSDGWSALTVRLDFENGKPLYFKAENDPYYKAFLCNLSISNVCGECQFNRLPRQSDITLGDYWEYAGNKFSGNSGVSCVVLNSEKGNALFSYVMKPEEIETTTVQAAMKGNPFLDGHCKIHPRRARFFASLGSVDFDEAVRDALKPTVAEAAKEILTYKFVQATKKAHNFTVKILDCLEKRRQRAKLKCRDFTILSNNCWAGFVYQKYGLPYRTPTIGLYIPGDDFVRFCEDWKNYLSRELRFIPWAECRRYPELKDGKPYPVARLGDIEIYFMHYASEKEAREKWERRKRRMNHKNMVFKLSQRECCGREEVERFLSLPLEHKICFAYDDVPGAIVIPELRDLQGDETPLVASYFDELDYLNRL